MTDVLVILFLVVYPTSVMLGIGYLLAYFGRERRPLPVFCRSSPYERIFLGGIVFGYVLVPALSFAVEEPSTLRIAAATALILAGCAVTRLIATRDLRRYRHLSKNGRVFRLRVVERSMPTHGGPSPRFVLTGVSSETGRRDLDVGPSAYHTFREGDELELMLDPEDPECWQILRPRGVPASISSATTGAPATGDSPSGPG